jgi:hypothetical protein
MNCKVKLLFIVFVLIIIHNLIDLANKYEKKLQKNILHVKKI